jgi:ubiquinone/menaquinone biosynthesis C-methylase UbiE
MKDDAAIITAIQSNGWNISPELWNSLSDYSKQFMIDELTGFGSYDYYAQRVNAIGFANKGKILDAACGNAQWSIVMNRLGNTVNAIDINEETVAAAKTFTQLNEIANLNVQVAGLEQLPFANESFDGIVCYSAIMYTDYAKTLAEFNRVLKKGGHVYISTDSTGWLVHLLVDKGVLKADFTATKKYLRRLYHKLGNERKNRTDNVVITRQYFNKLIESAGFRIIEMKPEGMISTFAPAPKPRYPRSYYGFESIIDVLIEKI